jgi:uncharacterized membrane protein
MTSSETTTPPPVDPQIQDGKYFALIGYLSVLCLVPLILKRGNRFAQFHGKQALVLFIFELAAGVLRIIPGLGEVIFQISIVVFGILSLVAILKVLMNEYWEIPVVHDLAQKITI